MASLGNMGMTAAERARGMDAVNLFFGALLGANLGTFGQLPLVGYVQMVAMLAGSVIAIQSALHARSRRRAGLVLGLYALLLGGALLVPGLRPEGSAPGDFARTVVTLAIWLVLAGSMKLFPQQADTE